MKRSQLNRYIAEADAFFAKNHFVLPPFAQLDSSRNGNVKAPRPMKSALSAWAGM